MRKILLLLLSLGMTGCVHSWQRVDTLNPSQWIAEEEPDEVRVLLRTERVELSEPVLRDGRLLGTAREGSFCILWVPCLVNKTRPRSLPVQDILFLEHQEVHKVQTGLRWAMIASIPLLVVEAARQKMECCQ